MCKFVYIICIGEMTAGIWQTLSMLYIGKIEIIDRQIFD